MSTFPAFGFDAELPAKEMQFTFAPSAEVLQRLIKTARDYMDKSEDGMQRPDESDNAHLNRCIAEVINGVIEEGWTLER